MKEETKKHLQEVVKKNYQEIATSFDATRKKYLWPEIENKITNLEKGQGVLDVGCGNGRLLELLKDKEINYLGLDNSEALIYLAQKNYPNNIFKVVDILELSKNISQKYDLVISVAVLHHLPSQELRKKAVLELMKSAKSGGQVVFSVWRLWNKKKYLKIIARNIINKIFYGSDLEISDLLFPWKNSQGEIVSERYYHAFTKGELKKMLSSLGLKKHQLITEKNNYWLIIDTP